MGNVAVATGILSASVADIAVEDDPEDGFGDDDVGSGVGDNFGDCLGMVFICSSPS